MQRKYTLLLVVFCMSVATGFAQSSITAATPKKSCSCAFNSLNQVGMLTGEKGPAATGQSINGMRYKTWFAGVGIGLDGYEELTVPLFLDVRKYLWDKTSTPFVYADGGYHFFMDDTDKKWGTITKYKGGLYYDVGFGYKLALKAKQALLLSAGYSFKELTKNEYTDLSLVDIVCTGGPCDGFIGGYKYRLNRLSFKVGFQF